MTLDWFDLIKLIQVLFCYLFHAEFSAVLVASRSSVASVFSEEGKCEFISNVTFLTVLAGTCSLLIQ